MKIWEGAPIGTWAGRVPAHNSNTRVLREIEQTLRANVPQIEYDKSKIDCHKLEIQQILGSIGTLGLSLTRDNGAEEPMDVDSVHTPTTSNPENGMNWPCLY